MNIEITKIVIEQSTKNILITYIEENNIQYPTIKGLNSLIISDWEFIDDHPEIIPYREIAWKDKERPE